MLVQNFYIESMTKGCNAQGEYITVIAQTDKSLSELLPYINGALSKTSYNIALNSLTIQKGIHLFKLNGNTVTLTRIQTEDEAHKELAWLKHTLNELHSNKDILTPDYTEKKPLSIMEIYKLLPKKNCKQCGQPTCLAFASQLLRSETTEDSCPSLDTAEYMAQKEQLITLLY